MIKLTGKFFDHSRSYYFCDWNENLIKLLDGNQPSRDSKYIEFWFCTKRCSIIILFLRRTGELVEIRKTFKTTKTDLLTLCVPVLELFVRLARDGYLDFESEDNKCQE